MRAKAEGKEEGRGGKKKCFQQTSPECLHSLQCILYTLVIYWRCKISYILEVRSLTAGNL